MPAKNCPLNIDIHKKEIANRGTPMFPCQAYITNVGNPITQAIPWHWHEEVEVFVVSEGRLKLELPGQCYRIKSGEGAFINSGVLQSAVKCGKDNCRIQSFVFHPSIIYGGIESVFAGRYVNPLLNCDQLPSIHFNAHTDWHREVVQCIFDAFQTYQLEPYGFELLIREKLSRIWYFIISNHRDILLEQPFSHQQDLFRLKKMLTYIHTNYANPIRLHHIAEVAAISERECLRCFKRAIGFTPMKYLQRHRISVAAGLLEHSRLNITEISRSTGFDSPSYFSLEFKKMVEMTPTEYRLKHKATSL